MKWNQAIMFLGLLLGAIVDIREKQISIVYIGLFGLWGVINQIFIVHSSMLSVGGGIGIGMLLMLLSKSSSGDIGMGDGLLISAAGICLGFWKTLLLIGYALFLCGIFSLILLIIKKNRKLTIPFIPFLCIGYLWMVVS